MSNNNNSVCVWCDVDAVCLLPPVVWPTVVSNDSSSQLEWFTYTQHFMDLQAAARLYGLDGDCMEWFVRHHVGCDDKAKYLKSVIPGFVMPGTSVSHAFGRSYYGAFREQYIRSQFPIVANQLLLSISEMDWEQLFGRDWWQGC